MTIDRLRTPPPPALSPPRAAAADATVQAGLMSLEAAAKPASDRFSLAPAGAAPTPLTFPSSGAPRGIPDVSAILGGGARHEDLNMRITSAYNDMAPQFQAIIDPSGQNGGLPNWFAMAVYASRSAGQGMSVAHALNRALEQSATTLGSVMRFAFSPVPGPLAAVAAQVATAPLPGRTEVRQVAALATHELQTAHDGKQRLSDSLHMFDPRLAAVTTKRLSQLLWNAPGASLHEKVAAVTRTVLDGLEDGNRAIFADMGAAAADYLRFRERHVGSITPEDVIAQFTAEGPSQPEQARRVFERACAQAAGMAPLPTDLAVEFPTVASDSRPMFPAAFALYEQAGRTTDARVRDRLVMYANNLLAWREQHDVVRDVFDPSDVRPGEVKRQDVWQMLTPLVDLKSRAGVWRYADYASAHDDDGEFAHLLTPAVAKKNWGRFEDRWPAILNAFDQMYAHAPAIWPMPNPNPMKGIDEPVA